MDNFMDKLAKRFNAGELIQANGEAEARENQRLKEQMDEYDKVIQEVRRLNLKTMEVSEQVSQMAAAGIEQIESYQAPASVNDYAEDYTEEFISLSRKVDMTADETRKQLEDATNDTKKQLEDSVSEMRKQLEDSVYRLEAALSQAEASIAQMEGSINQVGSAVSRVELGSDTNQRSMESAIRGLEQVIREQAQQPEEGEDKSVRQIKEMIVNVRLYLDEVQKHIEDYVHKEDVKVYRNVQAAVSEQLSLKTRDLNDHMDQMEKEVLKNKGTKGLVVLAVVLSGASLVLQVLQMLNIL